MSTRPKDTRSESAPSTVRVVRWTPPPADAVVWEPSERWVRGVKGEVTVVDSRRPVLVWEPGRPVPLYAFPEEDVRRDLLRDAARSDPGRHPGATAFYDLESGGERVANAAWRCPGEELAGYIAFEWLGREVLDHWYEEETEIFVHPHDPHQRVDALPSSRQVRVEIEGTVLAETRRPVLLFETGLPVRYYLPREDVRLDLLIPVDRRTECPYKGVATEYWSWSDDGEPWLDLAWSYPDPLPAVRAITGHVAFYNELVDIVVDGRPG